MARDVRRDRQVRGLLSCLSVHLYGTGTEVPMGITKLSTEPFAKVAMDILGPVNLASSTGKPFLLVYVRQICEKYLGKGKDVYFAFLDLEKAYDRVDRDAMWNVLRVYGIGGRLLRGVKSLYVGSKACVRVGNEVSEWFPVSVGLRQGCVMSPWLFNLYIDGVVREEGQTQSRTGFRSKQSL